jgi:hypothetical protein
MNRRRLSPWRRSGVLDRGTLVPPTAGVPPEGRLAPTVRHRVWAGLDTGGPGRSWQCRVHHRTYVRWAEAVSGTAHSRQGFADTVRPRRNAVRVARGVRLSPPPTVSTPISQGFDFFGPRWRTPERPNDQAATRQILPSRASLQALTATITALCTRPAGRTPAPRSETLHPLLRGGANDPRDVLGGETFATLDNGVGRRRSRGARGRPPTNTGRWIAARSFPPQAGDAWRFSDPLSGPQIIRVREAVKPPRHRQVQGDANPVDSAWAAYFQHRARHRRLRASAPGRAHLLPQQPGRCPVCRPGLPGEEARARHHRAGHHQQTPWAHLVFRPPTCHRPVP